VLLSVSLTCTYPTAKTKLHTPMHANQATCSIVSQLGRQIDLNTLHDLSRTCRQFRANLLEYRNQLIRHTLHCESEEADLGARLGTRLLEAQVSFRSSRQLTSGRMGKCARDMVGECQRCGSVVCRVSHSDGGAGVDSTQH
jgi:hypothetical protein